MQGNFVLRPRNLDSGIPPLGVIHFLGGAFVGVAPHITYRYLLERLSDANFIIVATPYQLDLDYVRSCDLILSKFDNIGSTLAAQYGPLPVIGVGHSCGALLHTLITCLFPGAPRAANVLISFNNKPASTAIPGFQELFIPLADQLMSDDEKSSLCRQRLATMRNTIDTALDTYAASALAPSFVANEALPFLRQGLQIVDQLPFLFKIISEGQQEFEPSPKDTKEVCRRMCK